jgi:hypothetical protein
LIVVVVEREVCIVRSSVGCAGKGEREKRERERSAI